MSSIPTLPGISSKIVETPRLRQFVRFSGPSDGIPVLFVHGNASSATFWEETMLALPEGFQGIAPDLRGYGDTEDKVVDATRGVGDWVDDLLALMEVLGHSRYHVVGHSLGGSVLFGLVPAAGQSIRSVTLMCPGSPYGFGGTKDTAGTPCFDDCAGSGGGTVNPEFARLIGEGARGSENPQASPRIVMNSFYWKPPFIPAREEELLSGVLSEKVGPERYPGDFQPSNNWPGVSPGIYGPVNAISAKYVGNSVERFLSTTPKPPVLWIRGAEDQIVSDTSLFDLGFLGQLGAVPGWPGAEVFPPQPMVSQTRAVLEQYAAKDGSYQEVVIAEAGHSPYIEKPDEVQPLLNAQVQAA